MTWLVFSSGVFVVAALIALALLIHARFERRRGPTAAYDWLVAAQVAFLLVALPIEQLGYDFDAANNPYWMRFAGVGLVLFPALLARSICALCGSAGWGLRASDVLSGTLALALLLSPTFPGLNSPDLPVTFQMMQGAAVVQLVLSAAVSIRALSRVTKGQSLVVRQRARLLIGAQVVFALSVIGWLAAPGELASIIATWVLVLVGGLLIAALVWPRRLLSALGSIPHDRWQAFGVLMASTDVRRDLAGILDDLADTWGLVGAAVVDRDGTPIECRGAAKIESSSSIEMHEQRFAGGEVAIVAWTNPLSLPFTRSDDQHLSLLAMMVQFALEREAELVHRAGRAAAEVAAAKSLADANQRLVEADEMKSRFVSTASHELRTPLTSIIGLARTCSQRWDELDPMQLRGFQGIIVEQGERLERIVDNLLTTSRVDAGMIGMERQRVQLRTLIDVAIAGLGATIADADVVIAVAEDGGVVVGDEQAIYEILINLLSNAHKYGEAPFRVSTVRRGDTVELLVQDSGRGVDQDMQDRIFERFARGVHLEQPGTGLGLSIVRDLAHALDGEAGYRPLHPGSEFWVQLPAPEA